MTKEDIGRIALGAPALQQVVLVSLPDCLPVKQWTRGEGRDSEAAAAHMGSLFRQAVDTARAAAARGKAQSITVETDDAVLMVTPLGPDAAAGFVFDRSAPLGLIRMQARQLSGHLAAIVPAPRDSIDLPPPEPVPPSVLEHPDGPPRAAPLGTSPAPSPTGWSRLEPAPAAPTIIAPARPTVVPTATPASTELRAAPRSAAVPRPRAVRLLEFFHRYAPDPHAATLRLSLRTGIGLEQLERPEGLSEDQVEALASAVRDILGQEQLGV
jgi:predicted regulator of Ras-like GTPase activity (Roadblock/LC7/MglB family)